MGLTHSPISHWGLDWFFIQQMFNHTHMPSVELMAIVNTGGVSSLQGTESSRDKDICSYIAVVESSTGGWTSTEEAATNGGAGWKVGKGFWREVG